MEGWQDLREVVVVSMGQANGWKTASRRQNLNDFDRFKLFKSKSAHYKILAKAVNIKKNKLSKAGKLKKF